jgi:molecular chaperone GrpE
MPDPKAKRAVQAELPTNAVEEALRSIERIESDAQAEPAQGAEQSVEVEAPAQAGDAAALAAEVEDLRAQLELSQEKGREALEKLREEHDRLLRTAADLENTRKRAQREREEVQKFATERLLKDLLPVVDNLDRALAAAPAGDPLADGVKLVRSNLEQVLGRQGVKPFSALGRPFDPSFHEALMQVPSAGEPAGTVVLEHGRGFMMHDKLLRPAMVGVAVEAAPLPEGSDGAGGSGESMAARNGTPGHEP